MNDRPTSTVPKPHCWYTGEKASRNRKMRPSEKPESSERKRTIGSRANISNYNAYTQVNTHSND